MFGLFKKKEFMNWQEYSNRINMIEDFCFSQRTRQDNIKNMQGAGR